MSPIFRMHTRALADLERLLNQPKLKWLGTCYPCVPSTLERGTTISFGGRLVDIRLTLTVRTEVIQGAAKPLEAGKLIEYDGVEYRVALVKTSSPGDHIRLQLIDPNR
jgi:hypothetical protein